MKPKNITITYRVSDNGTYDLRGRKQARVEEIYEGINIEPKTFIVPGIISEAFVRARREIAKRELSSYGYNQNEPIDWSFLRDLKETKQ